MSAPNFFLGVPFESDALTNALDASPPPDGVRTFAPADRHLTVAFLGPCAACDAHAAWEASLELPLFAEAPLRVSLGAVVPMGNPRRPSALSALLVNGREVFEAWMALVRDPLCDAASRPRETRPPKAHLTVARPTRRASDATRRAGIAWAAALDLHHVVTTLDRLALYTWAQDREARLFDVVAERRIAPARE
ncbi:MAG: hypothetical protein KF901_28330 [Myxococcales bacterium]|nr:hypothetical protein [Myxococcales bacterium]